MSTIKKYKLLITFIFFVASKTHALSPEYEKQLYIGCYGDSKKYIGADGAKIYCTCIVDKLSKKFSNKEVDKIFKKKAEEIMRAMEFATNECENSK